jgi:NAD(P)-dependent dehydrogenase (short-subunit alcohol dehydrogenase family)
MASRLLTFNFANKVALVTGASSGIGRATAVAFARSGAKVVLSDVVQDKGQQAAEEINSLTNGKNAIFVKCDVSKAKEVENLMQQTIQTYGRLDCAFNNAGIEGTMNATAEQTEADFDRVIGVNLKGVWLCMKNQIPIMLKQGGGSIVNTSSIAGQIGFPGMCPYVASKHGVVGLTRSAALEYARKNIRINAVNPGVILTQMVERVLAENPQQRAGFEAATPMGRMGTPDEIAATVLFMSSEGSSFLTGQAVAVDGGWTVQ